MALAYYDDQGNEKNVGGMLASGAAKLVSMALVAVALAIFMVLMTYNFNDPSPMNVTTNSPTNAFGYMGAFFADPAFQILGRGIWILPLALAIWSVRFFAGAPNGHFFNRIIFLPLAVLMGSIFSATHSVSTAWPHDNLGMGGIFGDNIMNVMIRMTPLSNGLALVLWTLLTGMIAIFMLTFVAGGSLRGLFEFGRKVVHDNIRLAGIATAGFRDLMGNMNARTLAKSQNQNSTIEAQSTQPKSAHFALPNWLRGGKKSATSGLNQVKSRTLDLTKALSMGARGSSTNDQPMTTLNLNEREYPEVPMDSEFSAPNHRVQDIVSRKYAEHQRRLKMGIDTENNLDADHSSALGHPDGEYLHGEDNINPSDVDFPVLGGVSRNMGQVEPLSDVPNRSGIVQSLKPKFAKMSNRAKDEAQPSFTFSDNPQVEFEKPALSLLQSPDTITRHVPPREALEASARQLEAVLEDYGIKGEIIAVKPGPVVTMYELEPAAGLKASRVIGLADDIARSMAALTARVATIPGRSVIGIELPNDNREMVLLREIFAAKNYGDSKLPLPLALGKDIAGEPIVANLAKMPHLLIAGTTGSGKSVAINTMILSLLYHASPEEVRMIMIDPKMLELSVYDDIPHLLSPVVTDPKKAVVALKWAVSEMEERYRKMSKMGVRNIDGYNSRVVDALNKGEGFNRTVQTGFDDATGEPIFETEEYAPEKMPYIVVIVDEMADLMMVAGKEIEACIQRLAQMARASGIHLIMATQRPSVDVITGTIKANFPTRISFQVTSKIDSRTILGEMGAEQLLGQGDMLYMAGGGRLTRVHAPFVSDEEVEVVVQHLKSQGEPVYVGGVVDGPEDEKAADIDAVLGLSGGESGEDALYDQAVMIAARDRKCSTSYIQRKLSIGYNKAAGLVERMEDEGVVSAANHVGKREILVPEI